MLLCHLAASMDHNKNVNSEDAFSKSQCLASRESSEKVDVAMVNCASVSLVQKMNAMIPQQHHDQMLRQSFLDQDQQPYLMKGFMMNKKNLNVAPVLNDNSGWIADYHTGVSTYTLGPKYSYTNSVRTIPSSRTDVDDHHFLRNLPKKRKSKSKASFPQKLMRILSIDECQHALRWMPDGCSFCIIDPKALVNDVLPKYFKEAKYSSFTRKLNRWGFKHFSLPPSEQFLSENEIPIYCHDKFLRHNPTLCEQMDGGYRRLKEVDASGSIGSTRSIQGSVLNGVQLQQQQQLLQQQSMMATMNQLYQVEQQRMTMLQQLLQQEQRSLLGQSSHRQGSHYETLFMGQSGGGGGGSSAVRNNDFSGFNDHRTSFPGRNLGNIMNGSILGMNQTSLGFTPYLPMQNLRDMDFILGSLSSASNAAGKPFIAKHDANRGMSQTTPSLSPRAEPRMK